MLRAADLLLQERVPKAAAPVFPHAAEASATRTASAEETGTHARLHRPERRGAGSPSALQRPLPRRRHQRRRRLQPLARSGRHALARGCHARLLGHASAICATWTAARFWSTAWQPTLKPAKTLRSDLHAGPGRVPPHATTRSKRTREISVSPEDDIELRRITLTNRSESPRTIEVTSYAEVVLAPQAQDLAHPAFSNLFVQTELVRNRQAILCTRRPRSAEERPPWLVHMMTVRGTTVGEAVVRDRSDAVHRPGPDARRRRPRWTAARRFPTAQGPVLDPVVCIRQTSSGCSRTRRCGSTSSPASPSRATASTALTEKYHDPSLADRVFDLAWTHSHILLQQLNATEADAQVYGRLAGSIIYASALRRAKASVLSRNRRGQSGLWGYGISGDLPIVLVRIRDRDAHRAGAPGRPGPRLLAHEGAQPSIW